ncbi:MAG TPA: hypothetical protein VFF73_25585 [Planctomycetota bacterium]|nr:hypothetical protein [Planctomycetota bacterium]
MGVSLNHPTLGQVGWAGSVDSNWTTIEGQFVARKAASTTTVTVSSTTSETALISTASIPANTLVAGFTIRIYAAGSISIPSSMVGVPVTYNLRWGGLGGTLLQSAAWSYTGTGAAYTVAWSTNFVILCTNNGATGHVESDGWFATNTALQVITGAQQIDTTGTNTLLWTVTPSLNTVSVTQRVLDVDISGKST